MLKKSIVWYLVIAMFLIGIAPRVEAAFAPSQALALSEGVKKADIDKIGLILENKVVAQRLQDLGYTQEEVTTRLSQLTDEQIHGLAQKLDKLNVGQDGGVIIVLLIIVIIILVYLYATGKKVVVTK
jgi:hypothetical protein